MLAHESIEDLPEVKHGQRSRGHYPYVAFQLTVVTRHTLHKIVKVGN